MATLLSSIVNVSAVLALTAGVAPADALAQMQTDAWKWRATLYGWFPGVSGTASQPVDGGRGNDNVNVDVRNILKALDLAFMAQLEVRKGRWGGATDLIYLEFRDEQSGTRDFSFSGPGGIITIPADAGLKASMSLKGMAWTLAGTYTAIEKPGYEMLLLGGFRYLGVKSSIDWQATVNVGALPPIARSGSATSRPRYWDAIVGVRGRADLGQSNWYVPYYIDIGTGDSDRTWQALIGIGYRFGWGALTAAYRHLDYKFDSAVPLRGLQFSGMGIGASWRW